MKNVFYGSAILKIYHLWERQFARVFNISGISGKTWNLDAKLKYISISFYTPQEYHKTKYSQKYQNKKNISGLKIDLLPVCQEALVV